MNFDTLPLIHRAAGAWIALGLMMIVGLGLVAYFWRKRYLGARR
jgi:Mg2+ and Co2+ transporter CorA